MVIVCGNRICKYRKGEFCGLDYVMLNGACQCSIFWDKNGAPRPQPDYREVEKPRNHDYNDQKSNATFFVGNTTFSETKEKENGQAQDLDNADVTADESTNEIEGGV